MTPAMTTVRGEFRSELLNIIQGSEYDNTVKAVRCEVGKNVTDFPTLTLVFDGPMEIKSADDNLTEFDHDIPFIIECAIQADKSTGDESPLSDMQESLLRDVLHSFIGLSKKYLFRNDGGIQWNVKMNPPVKFFPVWPNGDTTGTFGITGFVHVWNLGDTF